MGHTSFPSLTGFSLALHSSRRSFLCLTRAIPPAVVPSHNCHGQGGSLSTLHALIGAFFSRPLAIEKDFDIIILRMLNQGTFGCMPKMGMAGYKKFAHCIKCSGAFLLTAAHLSATSQTSASCSSAILWRKACKLWPCRYDIMYDENTIRRLQFDRSGVNSYVMRRYVSKRRLKSDSGHISAQVSINVLLPWSILSERRGALFCIAWWLQSSQNTLAR